MRLEAFREDCIHPRLYRRPEELELKEGKATGICSIYKQ
jgi:hypothetical protein